MNIVTYLIQAHANATLQYQTVLDAHLILIVHMVKHVIRKQDVVQMALYYQTPVYVIVHRLDTMVFVQVPITVHVITVVHHTNRVDIRIPPMPAR